MRALAAMAMAAMLASAAPTGHWHLEADNRIVLPPDAPDPDGPPVAPPMLGDTPWAAPRLFGQTASVTRDALTTAVAPVAGPFSVELWVSDHVNRPVGALAAGVDAAGQTRWALAYMSIAGNDKFDRGGALRFGPVEWVPDAADRRVAPWRRYLHHIVGTYADGQWRLYHNGVLVGEAEAAPAPFTRLNLAGYLGAEPYMRLPDLVRDVWLHDHAMTAQEVAAAFAARQAEITSATRGAKAGLRFTAGPYLTPPGATEQPILWETNAPATGTIEWGESARLGHRLSFDTADRLHRAAMTDLKPGQVTFYRVTARGADGQALDSGLLSFRAMPMPGAPLVFAAMGDTQERPFINHRLAQSIWQARPDFLLLAGDLIGGEEDERRWHWTDEYFAAMGPLVARVPVLAARGNGDVDVVDPVKDTRRFVNFDRYHNQPDGGRGYYRRRIGDVEFFVLDGNLAMHEREAPGWRARQRNWLAQALAGSTARWKIAVHHQPAWNADDDDYGDSYAGPTSDGDPEIRRDFVDLYERYGVDLVLSGHIHSYERSWPLIGGVPRCGGVTYVTVGGGGGDSERAAPVSSHTAAALYSGFHYALIRVWGDTLQLQMRDVDGRLRDDIRLAPHAKSRAACAARSRQGGRKS